MKAIVVKSYGKINLSLDVLYKRDDNYHEIRSVMQTIDLFDKITFKEKEMGITIETDNPHVPIDSENIVYKAWDALRPFLKEDKGIHIRIEKNIPVSAGLAGGSSNGAVTLKTLNEFWKLNLSEEKLRKIGAEIGADIPFCLMGGTALAEGIGEELRSLKPFSGKSILLCNPGIEISTSHAYGLIDTRGEDFDQKALLEAIEKDDIYGVAKNLKNKMEEAIISQYPVVQEIKDTMNSSGALASLMSGSGPTVFGIFDDEDKLKQAYEKLSKWNEQVYITKTR